MPHVAMLAEAGQLLASCRDPLIDAHLRALRRTVFSNRFEMRPADLRRHAVGETDDLLAHLDSPSPERARARGAELARAGLREAALFELVPAARRALFEQLPASLHASTAEMLDARHASLLTGFIAERERVLLEEQERIREALQRTLGRYTAQMQMALEVARAATSTLALGELLSTSVELIRRPFGFFSVGLYLADETERVVLRAAAGEGAGGLLRAPEPASALEASLREGALKPGGDGGEKPQRAELSLPLTLGPKVLGALWIQGAEGAAFSDQELAALTIVAGQLARAIENARLFSELEKRVDARTLELSQANERLVHEVQERRLAEEALRDSEMRFRSVAQSANDAIISTNSAAAIVFWNRGAEAMFGYAPAEIIGRPLADLIPERLREQIAPSGRIDGAALGQLANKTIELRGRRRDGQEFPLELSLASWQAGPETFYSSIIRDITERRAAERIRVERTQAIEHARALQYSNRELEQFAFTASHDLQEPLRKIQAFSDRLRTRYAAVIDEHGRDYLERMQSAAARMQRLIDDLLTYSRVTTRAQPFVPVALGRIAREVLVDLEVRIEQTGGRVEIGELPELEADPTQMRQLLQNLIGNALKFHKKQVAPQVKVRGELVPPQPGEDAEAGHCRLLVEDNGIGIESRYQERIFKVFQRLHGRDEYEGTGVGLAVCRRIVERHAGAISVESVPEVGSRFIVRLPVRQPGRWREA